MPKMSAGILLYRRSGDDVEVLLVHPGGPFWAKKDLGAWSIPKGEYDQGDDPLETALRELEEETGHRLGDQDLLELGTIRQRSGKVLSAWAAPGDLDAETITSNTFTIEWPPRSGSQREFPEVDRAEWFDVPTAREKVLAAHADDPDQCEQDGAREVALRLADLLAAGGDHVEAAQRAELELQALAGLPAGAYRPPAAAAMLEVLREVCDRLVADAERRLRQRGR